jgi:hypothetical protein
MPTIDWDGEQDLISMANWILEDIGVSNSLDEVFRKAEEENKRPEIITKIGFSITNRYINKIRKA